MKMDTNANIVANCETSSLESENSTTTFCSNKNTRSVFNGTPIILAQSKDLVNASIARNGQSTSTNDNQGFSDIMEESTPRKSLCYTPRSSSSTPSQHSPFTITVSPEQFKHIKVEKDADSFFQSLDEVKEILRSQDYEDCVKHPSDMLERNIVCMHCKILICALCMRDFHDGHPVISFNKLKEFKNVQENMIEELSTLQLEQKHLTVLYNKQWTIKQKIETSTQSLLKDVGIAFGNLEKVIKEKKTEIENHIMAFQQENFDEINVELDRIKTLENDATVTITKVVSCITELNPKESFDIYPRLKSCIDKCRKLKVVQNVEEEERQIPEEKFDKILPSLDSITKICGTLHPEATKVVWSKVTGSKYGKSDSEQEKLQPKRSSTKKRTSVRGSSSDGSDKTSERRTSSDKPVRTSDRRSSSERSDKEAKVTPEKRKKEKKDNIDGCISVFKRPKTSSPSRASDSGKKDNNSSTHQVHSSPNQVSSNSDAASSSDKEKSPHLSTGLKMTSSSSTKSKKSSSSINRSDTPSSSSARSRRSSTSRNLKSSSSSSNKSKSESPCTVITTGTKIPKVSKMSCPRSRSSARKANGSRSRSPSSCSSSTDEYFLDGIDKDEDGLPSLFQVDFNIMNMTTDHCALIKDSEVKVWLAKIVDVSAIQTTNSVGIQWIDGELGKDKRFEVQEFWKKKVDSLNVDSCICHFKLDLSRIICNELEPELLLAASVPSFGQRKANKENEKCGSKSLPVEKPDNITDRNNNNTEKVGD